MSSIVTDSVFGVDYDWNNDGTGLGGGYYLGRTCGGQVLANVFDIYENTQLTSISFHVSQSSVPGAKAYVQIYEQNGQIYLDESDEYTIQSSGLRFLGYSTYVKSFPSFCWNIIHGGC